MKPRKVKISSLKPEQLKWAFTAKQATIAAENATRFHTESNRLKNEVKTAYLKLYREHYNIPCRSQYASYVRLRGTTGVVLNGLLFKKVPKIESIFGPAINILKKKKLL